VTPPASDARTAARNATAEAAQQAARAALLAAGPVLFFDGG
jgi:hypothetical protein